MIKKADIIDSISKAEDVLTNWFQIKPGCTILSNSNYIDNFKLGVYTICPKCGEEVYVYRYTVSDNEAVDKYGGVRN